MLQFKMFLTAMKKDRLENHDTCFALVRVRSVAFIAQLLLFCTECPNLVNETELCSSHCKTRNRVLAAPY